MFVYVTVILYVLLLCSGAEQAQIYSHIRDQTQKHLDSYARDGLRTLCIAKKVTLQEGETKRLCALNNQK